MKLSQIIAYKNLLDDSTPLDTTPIAHDKLSPILNMIKSHEVQFPALTEQLNRDYKRILQEIDNFDQSVERIKNAILDQVKKTEDVYYKSSTELYNRELAHESAEYILDRKLPLFKEVSEILHARITSFSNWQYAAMIIRPAHEDWIDHLVSCDPLYLVDHSEDLLEPAILRFNDQYRRRLRPYVIEESTKANIFEKLPNDQFGYCLVYNFFNYKPIELIEAYLSELFNKLKPGGTLAMTFNDCDRASGIDLFERNFMSYTPSREVIARAEALGYVVSYNFRTDFSNTWLELQRPGKITSFKGGQSLSQIMNQ